MGEGPCFAVPKPGSCAWGRKPFPMKHFTTHLPAWLRPSLLALLLGGAAATAQAQTGVTIGAATAPDVSAALDIVSTTKGALLPRVADATALATPATGLLVFQTGGTPGFYYNAGTPAAPSWQQIATAAGAALTAGNGLTKTGSVIGLGGTLTGATAIAQAGNVFSLTGGNVGIGTSTPAGLLAVVGSTLGVGVLDVQQLSTDAGTGSRNQWQSFTPTVSGTLTQVDMRVSSPTGQNGAPGTLRIYAGQGTGGACSAPRPSCTTAPATAPSSRTCWPRRCP